VTSRGLVETPRRAVLSSDAVTALDANLCTVSASQIGYDDAGRSRVTAPQPQLVLARPGPLRMCASGSAIHRKLRALAAVFLDPASTEHEKDNAKRLKGRLEKQLSQDATPEGAWTGIMFRLGRVFKEIKSLPAPKSDWTDRASDLAECSVEASRGSRQRRPHAGTCSSTSAT
jgi:hypothetical protein